MVLIILVESGLIQALVKLGQDKDDLPNVIPVAKVLPVVFAVRDGIC